MSSWLDTLDDNRMTFERPGDKIMGRVAGRRTVDSDFGEVVLLEIEASEVVKDGKRQENYGQTWALFCGSSYLRRFVEEDDPHTGDYILLRFLEERQGRPGTDHMTKVIVGVRKTAKAVEGAA
jgi:hypothetical protein